MAAGGGGLGWVGHCGPINLFPKSVHVFAMSDSPQSKNTNRFQVFI